MGKELQDCIEKLHESITSEGFFYPYEEFAAFCISLKTKSLVLLAGISGTGKTRLVELVARQFGSPDRTIPVATVSLIFFGTKRSLYKLI